MTQPDTSISNRPPFETFTKPICRGSYLLNSACGKCEKCLWETNQMTGLKASTVADITDAELLRRAVKNTKGNDRIGRKTPRWVAVMALFDLGSTYAHQLCIRFGLDPEEMVKR